MDTMYERCCGLDIHKKTIEACFRSGKKKTHMSFGTTSAELRKLTMWPECCDGKYRLLLEANL